MMKLERLLFNLEQDHCFTKESPIPDAWKQKLLTIKKGEVSLHKFSPTGFYSSPSKIIFSLNLKRDQKDKLHLKEQTNEFNEKIEIGPRKELYVKNCDKPKILEWIKKGFSKPMTTPNNTLIWLLLKKPVRLLRID